MSVATGTLEHENYQAAVTPSEAEGSKAIRPNGRPPSRPHRTAVVLSDKGSWRQAQPLCCDGALDFSTPLEMTFSYQHLRKGQMPLCHPPDVVKLSPILSGIEAAEDGGVSARSDLYSGRVDGPRPQTYNRRADRLDRQVGHHGCCWIRRLQI